MKRVIIVDDTLCENRVHIITPSVRRAFAEAGNTLPDGLKFLMAQDENRRQIVDPVQVKRVFEGQHLEIAVRRAKRWMRGRRFRTTRPPRHIAHALAVFHKVDTDGFNGLAAAS